ncbi:hypothetical protein D8674_033774 [Pyrus ussuriensis x Pyrus communis]|uniref:Uncharacterized protein n=1 Tax=Pyrus ussuriensis x Pyrus communis TaxID=2448454 RepID=A0A5N5HM20_9ROSA|nr:hypothetical protein D8674_033774 [Pyrus ussuriensis x Pyrus communis]
MLSDDLINDYHLQKVNYPPPSFNLSVVQEFYANVPSNFPDSRVSHMGLSSFIPQSSICPSKLAPQRLVAPLFASYSSTATSDHSGVVAVKMVVIFAAKGK